MEKATDAREGGRRACVMMVHGTWGSRSPLASTDSDIGTRLARRGYDVQPFLWRGGNWHRDRLRAATDLGELLNSMDHDVVIVAHSHGGNVAQMALRAAEPTANRRHLVTLGTPFVALESPALGRSRGIPFGLATGTLWCIAAAFLVLGDSPAADLVATAAGAAAAFVTLSLLLGRRLRRDEVDRIKGLLDPPPATEATSVTAILTPGDEAGLVLSLGLLTGYISGGLLARVVMRLLRLLAVLVLLAMPIWALWVLSELLEGGVPHGDLLEELLWKPIRRVEVAVLPGSEGYSGMPQIARRTVGLFLGAVVVLPLIASVVALAFVSTGWDGLRMAVYGRLAVSAIPPGAHTAVCVDVPRLGGGKGLGHSRLTNDATVVGLVVAEVERLLEPAPGSPVARHMPTALDTWGTTGPRPTFRATREQRPASTRDAADRHSPAEHEP